MSKFQLLLMKTLIKDLNNEILDVKTSGDLARERARHAEEQDVRKVQQSGGSKAVGMDIDEWEDVDIRDVADQLTAQAPFNGKTRIPSSARPSAQRSTTSVMEEDNLRSQFKAEQEYAKSPREFVNGNSSSSWKGKASFRGFSQDDALSPPTMPGILPRPKVSSLLSTLWLLLTPV